MDGQIRLSHFCLSLVSAILLLLVLDHGKLAFADNVPQSPAEKKRAQFLKEAHERRLKKTKELKQMDVQQLAAELSSDSKKGKSPNNSLAFDETINRGSNIGPQLAKTLTTSDHSSFLALLALRKISPKDYDSIPSTFRVKVLVDALQHAQSLNAWGLPHLKWHEAAEALIEEKDAARPALVELLRKGSKNAPVEGIGVHDAYEKYHYRVSDYAWALLNDINKQPVPIPKDPSTRDKLIEELEREHGFVKPIQPHPEGDVTAPAAPGLRVQ